MSAGVVGIQKIINFTYAQYSEKLIQTYKLFRKKSIRTTWMIVLHAAMWQILYRFLIF